MEPTTERDVADNESELKARVERLTARNAELKAEVKRLRGLLEYAREAVLSQKRELALRIEWDYQQENWASRLEEVEAEIKRLKRPPRTKSTWRSSRKRRK